MIRLAVFGKPVKQSLSPRIHGQFARQCGLEVEYRAIETGPEDFPGQVRKLASEGGRGCNITVPLKHEAWKLATQCSENAKRAEAGNTLIFHSAREWYLDNTDGPGLVRDLQLTAGKSIRNERICLLGAGGASAGVLAALLQARPAEVVIANRTLQRANELCERHADLGLVSACMPQDLDQQKPFDLIINATSLGHAGDAPMIDSRWLSARGMCYDMNYGHAATPLRQACEQLAISYSDGLGMLVGQAALSFELWTGQAPDISAVLTGIRQSV